MLKIQAKHRLSTLIHFRSGCIGCGSCAELSPEHWTMSASDGKATLRQSQKKGKTFVKKIHEIDVAENRQAALSCPVKVIQLHEPENCIS